jgi:hypothetical protein
MTSQGADLGRRLGSALHDPSREKWSCLSLAPELRIESSPHVSFLQRRRLEALQHLAQLYSSRNIFMFHSAYFGLSSESYAPNHSFDLYKDNSKIQLRTSFYHHHNTSSLHNNKQQQTTLFQTSSITTLNSNFLVFNQQQISQNGFLHCYLSRSRRCHRHGSAYRRQRWFQLQPQSPTRKASHWRHPRNIFHRRS